MIIGLNQMKMMKLKEENELMLVISIKYLKYLNYEVHLKLIIILNLKKQKIEF